MTETVDSPVEAHLRATLRAVADAEPVRDGFADLRHGSIEPGSPWPAPGSTRRSRRLLAAAVLVVAVLTAGGIASVLDRDAPSPVRTVDPAPPTGFYLPSDLGQGWDLVRDTLAVTVDRTDVPSDLVRVVMFRSSPSAAGPADTSSWLTAEVRRISPSLPMPLRPGAQPLDRGAGDDARTYWAWPEGGDGDDGAGGETAVYVEATVGNLVLSVESFSVGGIEPLLDVADRWWASGGAAVAVDPALGLHRQVDQTFSPPSGEGPDPGPAGQVSLALQAPSGRIAVLTLSRPGTSVLPTGVGSPDGGASAGLSEEERPRPVDAPHLGAQALVWDGSEGGPARLLVAMPTLTIGLSGLVGDAETQTLGPHDAVPADLDELLDLLSTLEPVSASRWAEALGPVDGGQEAVAPDLASLFGSSDPPPNPGPTPGG